jgi:hypothetical protein
LYRNNSTIVYIYIDGEQKYAINFPYIFHIKLQFFKVFSWSQFLSHNDTIFIIISRIKCNITSNLHDLNADWNYYYLFIVFSMKLIRVILHLILLMIIKIVSLWDKNWLQENTLKNGNNFQTYIYNSTIVYIYIYR